MWRIFYKVQIVWYVCVSMLCFSFLFTEIWAENVAIEICISSSNFWFLGLGIIIFEKGHIRDFWAGSSCDDYLDRGGASRSPLLEGSIFITTIIAIIIITILGKVFIIAILTVLTIKNVWNLNRRRGSLPWGGTAGLPWNGLLRRRCCRLPRW